MARILISRDPSRMTTWGLIQMEFSSVDAPNAQPADDESNNAVAVAIIGDSVIAGLGARGRSYAVTIAERLGCTTPLMLARSTNTVVQSIAQFPEVKAHRPDVVIIGIGGA